MNAHRPHSHHSGFTLVELVVALVLTAIVISLAAMFVSTPVDVYFAQSRRSGMSESADAIKRTMTNDLRQALPNSVRIRVAGTRAIVEMLLAESGVTFYDDSPASAGSRRLDFTLADGQFDALGKFPAALPHDGITDLTANYHLVIDNSGTSGAGNAYAITNAGSRVITPNNVRIKLMPPTAPDDPEEHITLAPAYRFRAPLDTSKRMFLVSGPVTYICNTAANTRALRRYAGYPITANIPTSEASAQLAAGTNSLVGRDVTACTLRCEAGSTAPCNTALVIDISVSVATNGGNETLHVFMQHPLDNPP